MERKNKKNLYLTLGFLGAFIVWTLFVSLIDVQAIGPKGTSVGFAGLNKFVHELFGSNTLLYVVTDWLGLVPIFFMLGFAVLGVCQLIKRKSLAKVDYSIIVLGFYYIVVFFGYFFFEYFVINYRPVLIDGYLEASYPSSTTLLVLSVIPTTVMQLDGRIKSEKIKKTVSIILYVFMLLMVIGRLISGVHWFSDIIGGILLSISFVKAYQYFCGLKNVEKA